MDEYLDAEQPSTNGMSVSRENQRKFLIKNRRIYGPEGRGGVPPDGAPWTNSEEDKDVEEEVDADEPMGRIYTIHESISNIQ